MESRPRVVLGTIGHDAHIVGSSVLRYALEGAGLEPIFLGALVQPQEFIDAAKETAASAIWVSSLYGMGRIDCVEVDELGHFVEVEVLAPDDKETAARTVLEETAKALGLTALERRSYLGLLLSAHGL